MKNRLFIVIALVLIIIIYMTRVIKINSKMSYPVTVEYTSNQNVPIECDYFDNSYENMDGYSVRVSETQLFTAYEFSSNYDVDNMGDIKPEDYILLIRTVFINDDNDYKERAGINLHQYILQESSYICFPERNLYGIVNGFDSMAFSLRKHSEFEIIIPYRINSDHININRIKNENPKLVVSLYPHKKSINLMEVKCKAEK